MTFDSKKIFLFLTILMATVFVWPELNYQDLLSQGDHGRDLYAFDAVTHGKLPYKDFWWVYGPIMPYYYGLFLKIFGVHITSVLLGRALLVVLLAVFFYLSALTLMGPGLAFLGAAWFTQSRQEFFFTYNHVGGLVAELVISWCLLSYIKNPASRFLWIALLADFILGLVKINFGLAGLVGIIVCVWWIDHQKRNVIDLDKKKFYAAAVLGLPAGFLLINWLLLHDLPFYAIRQCMPYFGDDQPYHASPLIVFPYYLMQHWLTFVHSFYSVLATFHSTPNGLLPFILAFVSCCAFACHIALHGCTLIALYLLISKRMDPQVRQNTLIGLGVIGAFFVFYFHEFLVSGVWYRHYWSVPFLDLFHFVMIAIAFKFIPKFLRVIVVILLGVMTVWGIVAHVGSIQQQKVPSRFLSMPRGQIYVGNEPQWTDTVNTVTDYLNHTLTPDDQFFAMPYDCLYYYLTGKLSPTRQLIFFDHIKIPPQQEFTILDELEGHHVDYVLMSSRIISDEHGLGVFGKTYCPLIAQYIHQNFVPLVRQGGDWNQPPGWANNHGVIILKRKF